MSFCLGAAGSACEPSLKNALHAAATLFDSHHSKCCKQLQLMKALVTEAPQI